MTLFFSFLKNTSKLENGVEMARMHARRKGKSGSTHPVAKIVPSWVDKDKKTIERLVLELNKEGLDKSSIGKILRDQYGVPSVKTICGQSVSDILKHNKVGEELPEDLLNLIKKAVKLAKHMNKNKKDLHNRRSLELTEAKIRRLQKYYHRKGTIQEDWKYTRENAALMVK